MLEFCFNSLKTSQSVSKVIKLELRRVSSKKPRKRKKNEIKIKSKREIKIILNNAVWSPVGISFKKYAAQDFQIFYDSTFTQTLHKK